MKHVLFDLAKGMAVVGAAAVLLLGMLVLTGCPEAQNMMQPVVSEPADTTPPAMVGEVKKPEETPATEPEESAEPTPPADTTPPTVVEVAWYADQQLTEMLTTDSEVHQGDTVYTVVRFSEPMLHTASEGRAARPSLYLITNGKLRQYRMLPHEVDLKSGEAKPLRDNTDYLCKYTVPADMLGTIELRLRVGRASADTAGNEIAETLTYTAPFMVTELSKFPEPWRKRYENTDEWAVMRPFPPLARPSVRLIYFLPSDRDIETEKVMALCQLIIDTQKFYADEMQRHGFGRKTFVIESDTNDVPIVHFIQGRSGRDYYHKGSSGLKIKEEVFSLGYIDDFRHSYFIVIDDGHNSLNEGKVCGLGGLAFVPNGNAAYHLGPIALRNRDETARESALGGSLVIPATGYCFRVTNTYYHELVIATHELGHTFGLEHDFREGVLNNETVMGGRGFSLTECSAEWLSVSRFFNDGITPDHSPGNIRLLSAPRQTAEGVQIRFSVADADGLHQAQLLIPENAGRERNSWGPLRLSSCKQLEGSSGIIDFMVHPTLEKEQVDRVMLQFIDKRGSITWATFLTGW